MNNNIQISTIIIIYQIIYLILNAFINMPDVISWSILPSLFIICIMYLTNCDISLKSIIILTIIKLILLILVIRISNFSFSYYLFGLILLLIYLSLSNISKVYKCNVTNNQLLITLFTSSIIYLYIYLLN